MTRIAEPFHPGRRSGHAAGPQRRTEPILHERGLSLTRLPYLDNDPTGGACPGDMIDQASRGLADAPIIVHSELAVDSVVNTPAEPVELQDQYLGHLHPPSG